MIFNENNNKQLDKTVIIININIIIIINEFHRDKTSRPLCVTCYTSDTGTELMYVQFVYVADCFSGQ